MVLDSSDRKYKILAQIVESYISTGEPVGSKTICESSDLSFSSATIRNEMAELVSYGYLIQPHVSSGRVPSNRGYRLYINRLMPEKPLESDEKSIINGALSSASMDPEDLLEAAADILAEITGFTAVMTTPLNQNSKILSIKFVQISRRGGMLVLVTSSGMVKNKLFRLEYDLNEEILKMFEKVLEEEFKGKFLSEITPETVNILTPSGISTPMMLFPIMKVFLEAVKEAYEVKVKICGQKNLLSIPGINLETVIDIFNFLDEKEKVLKLFSKEKYGVNFIVGEENEYQQLKNSSICFSRYSVAERFGFLGIIGPTRMDYSNVNAKLRYISLLVGVFLERILKGY